MTLTEPCPTMRGSAYLLSCPISTNRTSLRLQDYPIPITKKVFSKSSMNAVQKAVKRRVSQETMPPRQAESLQ